MYVLCGEEDVELGARLRATEVVDFVVVVRGDDLLSFIDSHDSFPECIIIDDDLPGTTRACPLQLNTTLCSSCSIADLPRRLESRRLWSRVYVALD